jgi:hypothetical protein
MKYAVFRILGPSGYASGTVNICTAPVPSINKKKTGTKTLISAVFATSLQLFIFEE